MRILFINPETNNNARNSGIPLGLIAIASYLIPLGHKVKIVDRSVKRTNVIKEAKNYKPDIIGISVIGQKSVSDSIMLSKKLHAMNIKVAWGGPFAACMATSIIKSGFVDFVFSGEGELAWAELLEALDGKRNIKDVDGIYSVSNGKINYNGMHSLGDLSMFPQMDFSLVNPSDYFQESFGCKKMLHICSAKGCPNHCTFCYNPTFNLSVYRKRPIEQVFNEISYLYENYSLDGIYFTDELWADTEEELIQFCNEFIKRKYNIAWGCQTTAGRFSKENYQLMYEAGCRWLFFGVESGSTDMLKKMAKNNNLTEVKKAVEYCNDIGIVTICGFIIGVPYETEEDLKKTVEFAENIPASYFNMNYYGPLPGSAMCNKLESEGRYKEITDINKLKKIRYVEVLQSELCDVKPLEIKVIRNYFMWKSLVGSGLKKNNSDEAIKFFFKVVKEAIGSMFNHGLKNFFSQFIYDANQFLTILFYKLCFPSIRKKYNLK